MQFSQLLITVMALITTTIAMPLEAREADPHALTSLLPYTNTAASTLSKVPVNQLVSDTSDMEIAAHHDQSALSFRGN
ncbi:hypothetical protein HYALB_00011029 [Hymenoscyphus albidus]|uniref:Uncharacterized protein n=1 Tax=Hymenoscyphus albidus TaxID=595503 RepID=A0A9N9LTS4_9HELO|nr:hypothetical protein HYALB_00011029 [Hymenoscyphus albidus]